MPINFQANFHFYDQKWCQLLFWQYLIVWPQISLEVWKLESEELVHFSLRDVTMDCKSVNALRFAHIYFNFLQNLGSNLRRSLTCFIFILCTLVVNIPIYIQPTFVSIILLWKYKILILHKCKWIWCVYK